MKKVIITLGLLFCICSGLFSLGCPEREMSRSDEERVEAFMADFFSKMFILSEKEYEDRLYGEKVDIAFMDDSYHDGELVFKKFVNYSSVPEDKKFDDMGYLRSQKIYGSGKEIAKFMSMFKNTGKISGNDKAEIEWFSGFDEVVGATGVPCKNCCSFNQNIILLNGKDEFKLNANVILYVDEKEIRIAFMWISVSELVIKEYEKNKIYLWRQ